MSMPVSWWRWDEPQKLAKCLSTTSFRVSDDELRYIGADIWVDTWADMWADLSGS